MSATSLMTFAEFEQLPDEPGKMELIDGEVIHMPPPKNRHGDIAMRIFDLLKIAHGSSRVMHERGYRIGRGWLQPDVSVTWPDQATENDYYLRSPMIAVEVLSPGNAAAQIDRKLSLYAAEGVGEVWIVNDRHRTMTVYRGDRVIRLGQADKYVSDVAGVTVDVGRVLEQAGPV
jgi:Uma2 family endonuclease